MHNQRLRRGGCSGMPFYFSIEILEPSHKFFKCRYPENNHYFYTFNIMPFCDISGSHGGEYED
jgi:hypothetical protein